MYRCVYEKKNPHQGVIPGRNPLSMSSHGVNPLREPEAQPFPLCLAGVCMRERFEAVACHCCRMGRSVLRKTLVWQ
jgi:hypothetical protein